MLYDRNGPLLAALAALQLLGWRHLIRVRAEACRSAATVPWLHTTAGALLAVLGQHFFYCTGHTSQFSGLQYNAGFVGWDEFSYVRAGVLLAANTFGPHVMTVLLVPEVAHWCRPKFVDESRHGLRQTQEFRSAVLEVAGGYMLVRFLSLFFVTFGAALHRRHLMAWSLFAPRFVFEGITAAVMALTLLFSVVSTTAG